MGGLSRGVGVASFKHAGAHVESPRSKFVQCLVKMGGRPMHLPKPLGPYHVSFADFELRRRIGEESVAVHPSDPEKNELNLDNVPPMRFFYPTGEDPKWHLSDTQARRWLPHFNYTWGYFSKIILPSSCLRRFAIWVLTCAYAHPSIQMLQASVRMHRTLGDHV